MSTRNTGNASPESCLSVAPAPCRRARALFPAVLFALASFSLVLACHIPALAGRAPRPSHTGANPRTTPRVKQAAHADPGPAAGPRAVFPEASQPLTGIEGGSLAHFVFEVKNAGDRNLLISRVSPSCGCTVVNFDSPIAPGGTGMIRAEVQTEPFWTALDKTVEVFTNDTQAPETTLELKAEVIPVLTIEPGQTASVHYDGLADGVQEPLVQRFTIRPNGKAPFSIEGLPEVEGPVTAEVSPGKDDPSTYVVTVKLTPPSSGGDVTGAVRLRTNLPLAPQIPLYLRAFDLKGIAISPSILDFGRISAAGHSHNLTAAVFSRGTTFQITRVDCGDPALKAQFNELPTPISMYNVEVEYRGGWAKGDHRGVIRIYTDLPAMPVVSIPFIAQVP